MAKIEYFGHSCFRLTAGNGYRIVLDPYQDGSVPGLTLPNALTAEEVLVSHAHEDHNAAGQVQILRSRESSPFQEDALQVPHDEQEGALRGMNQIRILEGEGLKIAHFGDLGRMLNIEEINRLRNADVIMIPVGGYFTIDARTAHAIIDRIAPHLAIVMHYRTQSTGYSVLSSLQEIRKVIPTLQEYDRKELEIGTVQGIIAMKPLQTL